MTNVMQVSRSALITSSLASQRLAKSARVKYQDHSRKRKHAQYAHRKPITVKEVTNFAGKYAIYLSLLAPIMVFFKTAQVWVFHTTSGIPFLAWAAFTITSLFWWRHARENNRQMVLVHSLNFLGAALIVAGLLILG